MALTDLQKPSLEDFYNNVRDGAGALYRLAAQIQSQYEFLARVGVSEMDDLLVPTGELRTDLADYRTVLSELNTYFDNGAVTPASNPVGILNKLRKMNVI